MCNINVAVIIVILSIVVYAKCVGESEDGFERKRYELSVQTCLENFDIHTDMIIRTKDSRTMGAKYLSEADVSSRNECQKLCCETENCDVYIYEQKIPGSCYLFHCGSPENFKCKFTQHRNYTSAILTLNNRLNELENQIKLTKHEEELNSLRKGAPGATTSPILTSTKVPDQVDIKTNQSLKSPCSRNQFECRGSGECIAIYNTCDGIPQCSDGSDEAPELECPTVPGSTRTKQREQLSESKKSSMESTASHQVSSPAAQETREQPKNPVLYKPSDVWSQSEWSPAGYASGSPQQGEKILDYSRKQKPDSQQQLVYQTRIYGREGEGLAQQYPSGANQWGGYQVPRPDKVSHIFTHKGSGLVPENSDSQVPQSYGGDLGRSEFLKYAGGVNSNGYYNGIGQMYYPNNVQQRQQQQSADEMPQRSGLGIYGNGMSAAGPSDYYYEEPQFRRRIPVLQDPQVSKNVESGPIAQVPPESMKAQPAMKPIQIELSKPKITESVKKTLENVSVSYKSKSPGTKQKVETTTASSSKSDKPGDAVAAKLSMSDAEGIDDRPSGAILSLTLGMCITAIMIALVGCRLRVVRRRLRRSGKSSYAHDADFLVNGMYL